MNEDKIWDMGEVMKNMEIDELKSEFELVINMTDVEDMVDKFNKYLLNSSDNQMESRGMFIRALQKYNIGMSFNYLTPDDMRESKRGTIAGKMTLGDGSDIIVDPTRIRIFFGD